MIEPIRWWHFFIPAKVAAVRAANLYLIENSPFIRRTMAGEPVWAGAIHAGPLHANTRSGSA